MEMENSYVGQARELAKRLNGLSNARAVETDWWSDIVEDYDYDPDNTERAETTAGKSDVIVFPDGTRVLYDQKARRWIVA